MTTTLDTVTRDTTADPAVLDAAAVLAAASDAARASAAAVEGALQRRTLKMAAQLQAASRLLANGAHRPGAPVAPASPLARRAGRLERDLAEVDAAVAALGSYVVQLHLWRGHLASVPAAERPVV